MFYLRAGTIAIVELNTLIFIDFATGHTQIARMKRPLQETELQQIITGVSDPKQNALASSLLRQGLIEQSPGGADQTMIHRLTTLDHLFQWRAPADPLWQSAISVVRTAHASKRLWRYDLQQTPLLPESVVRKALTLDPGDGSILVMGDDDCLSLALAARGLVPTVIDADNGLLAMLSPAATSNHWTLITRPVDLRYPLPGELQQSFSRVILEPPSQSGAVKMFLSRAIAALKPGGQAMISITRQFARRFLHLVTEAGLRVIDRNVDFCAYYSPRLQQARFNTDIWIIERPEIAKPWVNADQPWPEQNDPGQPLIHARLDLLDCDPTLMTTDQITAYSRRAVGVPLSEVGQPSDSPWGDMYIVRGAAGVVLLYIHYEQRRILIDIQFGTHTVIGVDFVAEARSAFAPQLIGTSIAARGYSETADRSEDCPPLTTISLV